MDFECLKRDALNIPTNRLAAEIVQLKALVAKFDTILDKRTGKTQYGYRCHGDHILFNKFEDAVASAIEIFKDPDAGYYVTTYYL